jgi:hypothetical protein
MEFTRNPTRRDFLRTLAAGFVVGRAQGSARTVAGSSGPMTRVQRIGGVPTFVCGGQPVLRPAVETYVPTRHYFGQFAEAGTRIFGFSTNAAACDYGHSKTTWVESDVWDYFQFEERTTAVLDAEVHPERSVDAGRWAGASAPACAPAFRSIFWPQSDKPPELGRSPKPGQRMELPPGGRTYVQIGCTIPSAESGFFALDRGFWKEESGGNEGA